MRDDWDYSAFLNWAAQRAAELCAEFDHMPPVNFALGDRRHFEEEGIQARYTCSPHRMIEFSPGIIDRCWIEKSRCPDYPAMEKVLVHELVHAWVDATGRWSDFAAGHNDWFLWKAHQMGLGLPTTRHRLKEIIPRHEEIKLGWNPGLMPFEGWRELSDAALALDPQSTDAAALVSNSRVIAGAEARLDAGGWRETLAALERLNPRVQCYKVILEVAAQTPPDERKLAAALIMGGWKALPTSAIEEEYSSAGYKLCGWAEAIRRCEPLRRLVELLKERFDREGDNPRHFIHRMEADGGDDEAVAKYSEVNYLCFQGREPEIYDFFRLVLAP